MKTFETNRLILRQWKESDIKPFAKMNQDSKVLEYLPAPLSFEETKNWVEQIQRNFQQFGFGLWPVELKKTGEFIGYVGLNAPQFEAHFTPCVEIGWRLGSEYWGFGYATEAANAVLEVGFNQYGLKEIVSFTTVGNQRSIRVMEKIGMLRDKGGDFHHPKLTLESPLSLHVLYRKMNLHYFTNKDKMHLNSSDSS